VFNDPKALKKLNSIMHPLMHEIVKQKIEHLRRGGARVVILEATLLIEAKWTDLVDQVWVTISPEATVINRLVKEFFLLGEVEKRQVRSNFGQ
jgi:dephospho-CoA kinase